MVSLKVANLTYRISVNDLEYLFEKYGELGDIYMPKEKHNKESRGFAFVRFYNQKDAEDAIVSLNGCIYDGQALRVQMAKYGQPKKDKGFVKDVATHDPSFVGVMRGAHVPDPICMEIEGNEISYAQRLVDD